MEIITNLNQYFEIVGLLYTCAHPYLHQKELWEKAAADCSINADEFYRRISPLPKKYFSAFQKSMSTVNKEDFDFFFSDKDDEFVVLLQLVSANHPEWFENSLNEITATEIVMAFADILLDGAETGFSAPPSTSDLIALLKSSGYSPTTCWKMVLILQDPKENIQKLSHIVGQNLSAYENAIAAVSRPLRKLLEAFPKGKSFGKALHQGAVVTPTLIYPTLELVSPSGPVSTSYIGLFINDLYQMMEQARTTQEKLLPILKALSDSSKFDILLSLLKSPKYNLELAEELNLTAATVSHHMNVLLSHHLVNVEKRDGRVYYSVSKDTIRNTIQKLHTLLLGEDK